MQTNIIKDMLLKRAERRAGVALNEATSRNVTKVVGTVSQFDADEFEQFLVELARFAQVSGDDIDFNNGETTMLRVAGLIRQAAATWKRRSGN